jgi:hypothetical protein
LGILLTSHSISDIKFLYWHHNEIGQKKLKIEVAYNDGRNYFRGSPWDWSGGWLYSPQPIGLYSAATIFESQIPEELYKKMRFLRINYYQPLERTGTCHGVSPIQWFNEYVGAKTVVQLFEGRRGSLFGNAGIPSPEFIYVTTHRPELLLAILKANWTNYVNAAPFQQAVKTLVCEAQIPILNSDLKVKVKETFLPNPDMVERIEELGLLQGFGFIKEIHHSDGNWRFLSEFGVGVEQNLGFWLAALKKVRQKQQLEIVVMRDIYFQLWNLARTTDAQEIVRYELWVFVDDAEITSP